MCNVQPVIRTQMNTYIVLCCVLVIGDIVQDNQVSAFFSCASLYALGIRLKSERFLVLKTQCIMLH